jgi:hypothetical protein
MSTDLTNTTTGAMFFSAVYGTSPGGRTAFNVGPTGMVSTGGTYWFDAPFAINDITVAVPANGRAGHRFGLNWHWNPDGTWPTRSGTATCYVAYYTWDKQGEFLSGLLFSFGALAAGSYNGWSIPTTAVDYQAALPYGSGFMGLAIGTDDGLGNFVKLPIGDACMRFYPWSAPNDPYFPGTNPSSTAPGFSLDDSMPGMPYYPTTTDPNLNNPNFIIEFATETIPGTGPEAFIFNSPIVPTTRQLEPTMMSAIDTNAVYFEGTLDLQGIDPMTNRPVTNALFEIRPTGSTTPIISRRIALGPNGEFALLHKVDAGMPLVGDFDISVKVSHWLRKTLGPITMSGTSVTGLYMLALNGDCDEDNEVTIGDFAIISASFGKSSGDPGFDPMADIDRNDEVDIGDFALMSGNFGALGDD